MVPRGRARAARRGAHRVALPALALHAARARAGRDPRGHPDGRRASTPTRRCRSSTGCATSSGWRATTTTAWATSRRASCRRWWRARSCCATACCAARRVALLRRHLHLPRDQRDLRAHRVVGRGRHRARRPRPSSARRATCGTRSGTCSSRCAARSPRSSRSRAAHDRQLGIAGRRARARSALREIDAGQHRPRGRPARGRAPALPRGERRARRFWQASGRDDLWVRAIYAGEEPVGMLALVAHARSRRASDLVHRAPARRCAPPGPRLRRGGDRAWCSTTRARARGCQPRRRSRTCHPTPRVGRLYEASASATRAPWTRTASSRWRLELGNATPPPNDRSTPTPGEDPMKRILATPRSRSPFLALAQAPRHVPPGHAVATFGGGCFWCMEPPYDKLPGVVGDDLGLHGRHRTLNPTYEEVSAGTHRPRRGRAGGLRPEEGELREAARGVLGERRSDGEGPAVLRRGHRSTARRSSIHDEAQRKAAEASKAALEKSKPFKEPIVTPDRDGRARSIRPRTTTRTTTPRIRCATRTTATAAAATRA